MADSLAVIASLRAAAEKLRYSFAVIDTESDSYYLYIVLVGEVNSPVALGDSVSFEVSVPERGAFLGGVRLRQPVA